MECDGAVVGEFDLHGGAVDTGGDAFDEGPEGFDEGLIKVLALCVGGGGGEAGASGGVDVGVEGELADDEDLVLAGEGVGEVFEGKVHFAVVVAEDAESGDAVGEVAGLGFGGLSVGGDEDEETWPALSDDLAFDEDFGLGDSLDDGAHRVGGGGYRFFEGGAWSGGGRFLTGDRG